ncbi:MAG: hypothetical protein ABIK31_03480 [candidate division WOR-3 bacterium]
MRILVVYYSRDGHTRTIAQTLSTMLQCDREEIIDLKNRKGIFGWLAAGFDAFRKRLTKIQEPKYDPSVYDLIVIGTPNWAGMPAPAIRTYLNNNIGKIKNTAFFCTFGGSDSGKVFDELQALCQIKPKALLSVKASDVENNTFMDKIQSFVQQIKS